MVTNLTQFVPQSIIHCTNSNQNSTIPRKRELPFFQLSLIRRSKLSSPSILNLDGDISSMRLEDPVLRFLDNFIFS